MEQRVMTRRGLAPRSGAREAPVVLHGPARQNVPGSPRPDLHRDGPAQEAGACLFGHEGCPRSESHRVLLLTRQAHHSSCFEGKGRRSVRESHPVAPRLQLGASLSGPRTIVFDGRRRARTSCPRGHHARSRRGRRLGRFTVQDGRRETCTPLPEGSARLSRAARRARPVHRP